jgi:hypothetical protein
MDVHRVTSLDDLAQMAGSDTTPVDAAALRDVLIERGLLDWEHDTSGGTLTAHEDEFYAALDAALDRVAVVQVRYPENADREWTSDEWADEPGGETFHMADDDRTPDEIARDVLGTHRAINGNRCTGARVRTLMGRVVATAE